MRPALLDFCFGTPVEVEGVAYARGNIFFFEMALPKSSPSFPSSPTHRFW
jgi:hypothetical protein